MSSPARKRRKPSSFATPPCEPVQDGSSTEQPVPAIVSLCRKVVESAFIRKHHLVQWLEAFRCLLPNPVDGRSLARLVELSIDQMPVMSRLLSACFEYVDGLDGPSLDVLDRLFDLSQTPDPTDLDKLLIEVGEDCDVCTADKGAGATPGHLALAFMFAVINMRAQRHSEKAKKAKKAKRAKKAKKATNGNRTSAEIAALEAQFHDSEEKRAALEARILKLEEEHDLQLGAQDIQVRHLNDKVEQATKHGQKLVREQARAHLEEKGALRDQCRKLMRKYDELRNAARRRLAAAAGKFPQRRSSPTEPAPNARR